MTTARIHAPWDLPRLQRRPTRRLPAPRLLSCGVEVLEERFLLASWSVSPQWITIRIPSPAVVDQQVFAGTAVPVAYAPVMVSSIQVAYGAMIVSAAATAPATLVPAAGGHSTLATAQPLPADTASTVAGALGPATPPVVYQVPLDPASATTLQLSVAWAAPAATAAGSLKVLDSAGDVLVDQNLPASALSVALTVSPVSQSSALYIEIAPPSALVPLGPAPAPAAYNLTVQPILVGSSTFATSDLTFNEVVPSGPSTQVSGSGTTVFVGSGNPEPAYPVAVSQMAHGILPFPQAAALPIGGIFGATQVSAPAAPTTSPPAAAISSGSLFVAPRGSDASAGVTISAVADSNFLDLVPAHTAPSVTTAQSAPAIAVDRGYAPAPSRSTWPAWPFIDWAEGREADRAGLLGTVRGELPLHLVRTLPSVGMRTAGRFGFAPSRDGDESPRAALPRLVDEASFTEPLRVSAVADPAQPGPGKRRRVALAVAYGSACSIVSLSAPELTLAFQRTRQRQRVWAPGRRRTTEYDKS